MIKLSIDSKSSDPNENKDNIVHFKNGTFGSVFDKKLNKFIWKKYNEDKYSNAVNAYIFWNNLKYTPEFTRNRFKIKLSTIHNIINSLTKDLKKDNTELYYIKNQGRWYDGVNHFIDYLWDDVCSIVEKKHKSWLNVNFIFTDDIYVLRAMLNKSLIFQHNIVKDSNEIIKFQKVLSDFQKNNKNIVKEIKPTKFNKNKSIEIIFK